MTSTYDGPLLQVNELTVRFGGVTALDSVSFGVEGGSLTAVIGPNGAGKTTLYNCMTGVYKPTSGGITYKGEELTRLRPHRIARLGIARTFQNLALFSGMTVLDNLMLGRYRHGRTGILTGMLYTPGTAREEVAQRQRVEEIIDLLRVAPYRDTPVSDLSYGLRKRVELGRAVAQDPDVLLLDEPMAGMVTEEKEEMARFMLDVRHELGITLVLVEHDMGVVMDLAEQVVVLDFGRKIADGTPGEVQRDPDVIRAYLGGAKVAEAEIEAAADRLTDTVARGGTEAR